MSTTTNDNNNEKSKPNAALLESQYTYEEPEEEEQEQEQPSLKKSRKQKITDSMVDPWAEAMNNISLENIKKLATMDTYTVAGETYRRKMLTPRARIQLDRLQNESTTEQDEEKKMNIVMQQAILCLEGMTKEKFENTDIGHLEQVIGACIMAAKGFRKV